MRHIHIQSENEHKIIAVDEDGHLHHDNGPFVQNFIERATYGNKHLKGQAILDEIVRRVDRSSRISAHHCDQEH